MKEREAQLAKSSRVSLEGLAEQIRTAGVKDLPLIIKGDVTGSVEVLADSLVKMSTEKVRIKVIHSGVGSITESDVLLATASNTIIIGFNVRPERKAAELAQQEGIEIRLHSIIYELQDEIRLAMMGLLDPTFKENYVGRAEVLNVFRIPKVGTIAGCRVQDGVIRRDAEVKVMRGDEQVFKGKIGSLKRFKDDAREVTNGMECGIGLGGFSDLKEGDLIEAFSTEKLAADLGALTRPQRRNAPKSMQQRQTGPLLTTEKRAVFLAVDATTSESTCCDLHAFPPVTTGGYTRRLFQSRETCDVEFSSSPLRRTGDHCLSAAGARSRSAPARLRHGGWSRPGAMGSLERRHPAGGSSDRGAPQHAHCPRSTSCSKSAQWSLPWWGT